MVTLKQCENLVNLCTTNFQHDLLGLVKKLEFYKELEDFQINILKLIDEFLSNDEPLLRICVGGCKGSGKSSLSVALIVLVLMTQLENRIIYLSGKKDQSVGIFTNELNALLKHSPYTDLITEILRVGTTFLLNKITKQKATIQTFTSRNTKDGESGSSITSAGVHSAGLHLIIFDESPSIPDSVYHQFCGTVTSGKTIQLCNGNPDDDQVNFYYRVMTDRNDGVDRKGWHVFNLNFLELKRITEKTKNATLEVYPIGTEYYDKYVLGRYPVKESKIMIQSSYIYEIIHTITDVSDVGLVIYHLERMVGYANELRSIQTFIGIDVASGDGKDYTVVVARTGRFIEVLHFSNIIDLNVLKEYIIALGNKFKNSYKRTLSFIIDGDGLGKSLAVMIGNDNRSSCLHITYIHNRITKFIHVCYKSLRDQLYGQFALWLSKSHDISSAGLDNSVYDNPAYRIFLPNNLTLSEKLIREAKISKYEIDEGKKVMISKKKLPQSLDILDAIVYTFLNESTSDLY